MASGYPLQRCGPRADRNAILFREEVPLPAGCQRPFAVVAVVLIAFGGISALAGLMATQVTQLAGDLPHYQSTMREKITSLTLAGDPAEAADVAEEFLKERSLVTYYDEVALEGLRLARADVLRGVLDEARLNRIRLMLPLPERVWTANIGQRSTRAAPSASSLMLRGAAPGRAGSYACHV